MTRHYLVGDVAYPEANLVAVENGKPVVVIDPDDREAVERLAQAYAAQESGFAELMPEAWTMPAMRMRQALREFANPKPPKPAEPTGLGAVVEAPHPWGVEEYGMRRYVRTHATREPWAGGGKAFAWDDMPTPITVLSAGVQA